MTERERMCYAKIYLEKLADGINPLNGAEVAADDIVRNPRIANCFLYIADILGAVLENGGTETQSQASHKKQPDKPDYYITERQKTLLQISDSPRLVSEIAKELNQFSRDNGCQSLTAVKLNQWLISVGMLEEIDIGRETPGKAATPAGEQIGMHSEHAINSRGEPYIRTIYDETAQQFILQNLDAVQEFLSQL